MPCGGTSSQVGIGFCPQCCSSQQCRTTRPYPTRGLPRAFLDWSDGFESCFSSLSLGSPRPHLPASVLRSRRRPRAHRPRSLCRSTPLGLVGSSPCGWWGIHDGSPRPGWVCAASSVSASVPAAAARSCCSVVNLCWCSVPGSGPAPAAAVAGSGRTVGPACSLPCSSCTTSPTCHGGCSPLSLCKPPPRLPPAPGTAGGVLVTHRGLWACFRGL